MKRTVIRIISLFLALTCLGGGAAMAENKYYGKDAGEAWYQELLKDGFLQLGNNQRLQNIARRAQAGETLTFAVIGGSITEGAGANEFRECYASRVAQGLNARFKTGEKAPFRYVNAGVGGTPSTFGLMRYERDVLGRVQDDDGLPDIVIVEFAVNDYEEPSKHRCFESLVKTILSQPNDPVVILLFSVFPGGFNLQDEIKKIGETYDLLMVSVKDAAYAHVGKEWTKEEFFFDQYHPTSMGHAVMADCVLAAIDASLARETDEKDIDLNVTPAYGTDFMNLKTVYGSGEVPEGAELSRNGFMSDDTEAYSNLPIGRVCGKNFCHMERDPQKPLTLKATFSKLLIAWRATNDAAFGTAEVLVDGQVKRTLKGSADKWGQSEVILVWDAKEAAPHTVEIRMAEGSENKRFTITAIGYAE